MPGARSSVIPEVKGYWHERKLADWPQRAGAGTIDLATLVPGFTLIDVGTSHRWPAIVVLGWISLALPWLYNRCYRQTKTGQSWGKLALRLKLMDMSNQEPLLWWKAGLRDVAHYLDSLPFFLGFLLPIVDARRQTLADKAMRMVVVSVREVSAAPVPVTPSAAAVIEKSEPV
jgi:uncharacterized RDD family membrane protein YckC